MNKTAGFRGGSESKESTCNAGDPGLSPGLRRSPGEGHRNPLQHSCLKIPCTEEPVQTTGSQKSQTHLVTKQEGKGYLHENTYCLWDKTSASCFLNVSHL